jgi:hypothetical protein
MVWFGLIPTWYLTLPDSKVRPLSTCSKQSRLMVWFGSLVWTDSYLVLDLARLEGETAVHLLQAVQVNGLVWRLGLD